VLGSGVDGMVTLDTLRCSHAVFDLTLALAQRPRARSGCKPEPIMLSSTAIHLEIPATPDHFALARLLIARVAGSTGFTLDESEDLRLAIDELCFAVAGSGSDARLQLIVEVSQAGSETQMDVLGSLKVGPESEPFESTGELSEFSRLILDTLVDEYSFVSRVEGEGNSGFRMTKIQASQG